MEESGLLLLPDGALLAVLAYMAPRQLLNLRVLCRRLRDICLHPDLWRSVHLDGRLVLAALRLVPCLGVASLWAETDLLRRVASNISTCTCVVACLHLYVFSEADLAPATAIAERVAALGGMRALYLVVDYKLPVQPLPALFKMLYCTRQLRDLDLKLTQSFYLGRCSRDFEGTASLKSLSLRADICNTELLESLLSTHAATLENVQLYRLRLPSSLKDLPKLQSLTFDLEDYDGEKNGLSVLAEIANLETLHICDSYISHCPPEVLNLLRRSSRLRSVTMPFSTENITAPVLALAASPAARGLETLVLSNRGLFLFMDDFCEKVPEALAAALPLFSSLQVLDFELVSPDIFQRVVSSTLAPSLRTLRVRDWTRCAHGSLHNVQNLLARNPQLHFWPGRISFRVCICQWCESGCHKELEMFKGEGPALASHAKRIGCPANCFQLKC